MIDKQQLEDLLSQSVVFEPDINGESKRNLPDGLPMTVAKSVYEDIFGGYRHYNFGQQWCYYSDGRYMVVPAIDIRNQVWRCTSNYYVPSKKDESPPVLLYCNERLIQNTLSALSSFEGVELKSDIVAPCWLDGKSNENIDLIIPLNNGLLDLSGNEPVLLPHTSDFFCFNKLPHNYDPNADSPRLRKLVQDMFMENADLEDDDGLPPEEKPVRNELKEQCLYEWLGLLLTNDMRYQKMLGLIGPQRSGKGTIGRLIKAMLGSENVSNPTFAELTSSFGLHSLVNKKAAIFGDANIGTNCEQVLRVVEILKTISGQDPINIPRKYLNTLEGIRLGCRFIMLANSLQALIDPTGVISDRFIYLQTTQSFYGREDMNLDETLYREMSGIINIAIEGYYRLRRNGRFTEPDESIEMKQRSKEIGSNIIAFKNSGCRTGEGLWSRPDDFYNAFVNWCKANGCQPMKKPKFRSDFDDIFPQHKSCKKRICENQNPVWVFKNIEPLEALNY